MLGPLPLLHRWLVCALALLACVGAGAWLAATLPGPVVAATGAGIGAALGLVVVLLVLHDERVPPEAGRPRRLP